MQELEKVLEEINEEIKSSIAFSSVFTDGLCRARNIIRKHMNDGWIPVKEYGFPKAQEHEFRFWVTIQYENGFRRTIKATWSYYDQCFLYRNGKKILHDIVAYRYYSAPEPYRPEQPETCKYTGGSCCWPIDQCSDCPNHPQRSEGE